MRKISKKRAKQNREYKKIRAEYLQLNPLCERCKKLASEIHHKNGRNGERLIDINYFMSTCRECHNWIHENPADARLKGWLL